MEYIRGDHRVREAISRIVSVLGVGQPRVVSLLARCRVNECTLLHGAANGEDEAHKCAVGAISTASFFDRV